MARPLGGEERNDHLVDRGHGPVVFGVGANVGAGFDPVPGDWDVVEPWDVGISISRSSRKRPRTSSPTS